MQPKSHKERPFVVWLGRPRHDGGEYLSDFRNEFDYTILEADNRQELKEKLPALIAKHGPIDAFIVPMGTMTYAPFDQDLLGPLASECGIITSSKAGYDEFDVEWITSQGIWLCNTTDAIVESTSNMAIFLTLAAVRDTYRTEQTLRNGAWTSVLYPTHDITGMTIGIIGMGKVGKRVASKAKAFNMRVKYFNRHRLSDQEEASYKASYCDSLHALLSVSDIISINCPLNDDTRNLISTAEFAAMKDGSYLVNTARGAIVDEDALIQALESGKLARAGLDVFCNEPHINSYFQNSDKVICQPHMGGVTEEAFRLAEIECLENIRAYFKTGKPITPVNDPSARFQKE
ncbi:D-isomer specific 2-hydroxyacid dehydrogenase [Trichoderma sp. SZMC 28012]